MTLARCASLGHLAPATFIAGFGQSSLIPISSFNQLRHTRSISLLSYEEVSAGSPTPEHPVACPSRTLLVLHGLLGCGRNWRSWSRRLVEAAAASHPPEGGPWRALLLDMRCHGGSAQRPGLHPPNNMLSAAEDVSRLVRHLLGSHAPGAVLGHSLGGKVALALVHQAAAAAAAAAARSAADAAAAAPTAPASPHAPSAARAAALAAATAGAPQGTAAAAIAAATAATGEWCALPRQLWILDSQPGLVPADLDAGTGISKVLNTVHSVPLPIPARTWLLRYLRERGLSDALSQWLASNLVPLRGAAAAAAAAAPWHTTVAGVSAVAAAAAAAAPAATATAAAASCLRGSFQHHVLDRAGHWLHVDNPDGLLKLVLPRLAGL
ncbi:hypothetical protein VOLCADRAFT_86180 [Volvox carteri f. nagariensis]|uniref:AB hydrolase-1 domain-containing protein n=1 Tax=Volvox carteri f. nagariensis TaxID=3068 RepID=D8TI33_VOLCA|nr:uncharacterized protein VOLCADRAFT_86180 [Volvox carteri f. nagariensis]EFJ52823.1 hypothetical protein VOLCADRAFT_86180 [Volvox carteri f. nagariensis]|eukprot:XP_002945828.1 hypothetical protein VOLCADRAFT_86180 [Volvox carteri f. nagariensis]